MAGSDSSSRSRGGAVGAAPGDRQLHEQILDHAYDAILTRDLSGRILFWNRGAEEAYGWTAGEAAGRIIHDLMRTRFSRPLSEIEDEVLRDGRWEGELGYTCRDGREIVISSRWALLRGEGGEAAAILEIGRDVTERLRSETALRESEERFRQVAENIGAVFFMTEWEPETGLRLLYVSSAYERIWGRTRESLYENPREWVEATHPDDLEQVERALPGATKGLFDEEFRIVRPDGAVRWVHSRVFPVLEHKGEHHRNAGIVEDVTERHQAEEELRKAKDAAETASRSKDQFLATLSHELRTPLTPVLALASGLQEDLSLPPRVRQALEVIRRNVELEARLIDDLLDLTRISRGKLELHREIADVRQLLAHSVEICCQPEVEAGRLRMVLDLGAAEHRVWADAPRLTQVFWNLLKNAVKFTPDGGEIRVVSRDEEREDGGYGLTVEISDTGIGIDPGLLPRIFDAFEQTDRRITRRFGGLGLGLALSKAILEMHGGTLSAASAGKDKGSTFTVRLPGGDLPPAGDRPPAPLSAPEEPRGDAVEPPARNIRLNLLLVEDHTDTADAMADLLRDLGHRVTVAGSVDSALTAAAAEAGRIDLVISDLGLPDGSGLDLMRELSRLYGLKGVALSGYGMEEDLQRSREAGFAKHLTKPINLQALKTVLLEASGSEG